MSQPPGLQLLRFKVPHSESASQMHIVPAGRFAQWAVPMWHVGTAAQLVDAPGVHKEGSAGHSLPCDARGRRQAQPPAPMHETSLLAALQFMGGEGIGGGGEGTGGGGGGIAIGESAPQMIQPPLVTEPSDIHDMMSPACIMTLVGPVVPENCVPPTVTKSKCASVLK